jgi:mono/diheme cytochrome c family protein
MKLNVLLYKDAANPEGYDGAWPAKVREVEDDAHAPTAPWVEMSVEQFEAVIATGKTAATIVSDQVNAAQLAAVAAVVQDQKITDFKALQAAATAKP